MSITNTLERPRPLRNNDPLAHVYLLQDSYDGALALHRIHTEFITDMGERLENQPFCSTYKFSVTDEEIIYDTGLLYLESLRQSVAAAKRDVVHGTFSAYHAARQTAFLGQGENVLAWASDKHDTSQIALFSLCPPVSELSRAEAKKQSFKPERMMASVQLHAKNGDGLGETIAFSLDGLTLERLERLQTRLGITSGVANTTLDQLVLPVHITSNSTPQETAAAIIACYDELCDEEQGTLHKQGIPIEKNIVEANAFVRKHPETFELYKTIIEEVATSLGYGVTGKLARVVETQLARHFAAADMPAYLRLTANEFLSIDAASELIDYLRKQAIPGYLTKQLDKPAYNEVSVASGSYDIGGAGAAAIADGRVYDGGCPSSGTPMITTELAQAQAEQLGLKTYVTYETPKPILTKGEFDLLPIGSCPVCGAECGAGIRNRKSGKWYCTQASCDAFKQDIYDYVFGFADTAEAPIAAPAEHHKPTATRQKTPQQQTIDFSSELKEKQDKVWLLKNTIFSQDITAETRAELIVELIKTDQEQRALLRASLGAVAI